MIFALVTLVWSARFNRDPDVTLLYRKKQRKSEIQANLHNATPK